MALEHLEEDCWTLDEECPCLGVLLDDQITLEIAMCPLFEGVPHLCGLTRALQVA